MSASLVVEVTKKMGKVVGIPVDSAQKLTARQSLYERLCSVAEIRHGKPMVFYDDFTELRRRLGLENEISMKLLKHSVWHLNVGDRESNKKPLIIWGRPKSLDNHHGERERKFVIILL